MVHAGVDSGCGRLVASATQALTGAHSLLDFDSAHAVYRDFKPFWELVTGPLNAGTFGPNDLDNTFGPQVVFVKAPEPGQKNLPPSAGLQFFGEVSISGSSGKLTVKLRDVEGSTLFQKTLEPVV